MPFSHICPVNLGNLSYPVRSWLNVTAPGDDSDAEARKVSLADLLAMAELAGLEIEVVFRIKDGADCCTPPAK